MGLVPRLATVPDIVATAGATDEDLTSDVGERECGLKAADHPVDRQQRGGWPQGDRRGDRIDTTAR